MDLLELFAKRESVRQYSDRPVARDVVERCLEAARLAPSACNSQPWSFVVVDDPESRDKLCREAFGGLYSMNRFAAQAPILVVVVTERSKYMARMGGQMRGVQYSLIDIGIACEHFVLQAASEGVGTCWLGWFNERAVRRVLGLPRRTRIDILISMGYPLQNEPRVKVRKSLDDMRRYSAPAED